jgi:hypothetical protein
MDEIEETNEDGFGKSLAKTTLAATLTTFGMCMGLMAAGWIGSNVRTNVKKVKINIETKPEEDEA